MKARIYQPCKSSMQSGHGKGQKWFLACDAMSARVPDDLMGWVSAGDTADQIKIPFTSKDAAIAFAEKKGWEYSVSQNNQRRVRPRSYIDSFKYEPFE